MTYVLMRRLARFALPMALCAISNGGSQAADNRSLSPHRAVYEITLDKAKTGAGMADLTGRMVYELTGSECEGFTQTMRFVTPVHQPGRRCDDQRSALFDLRRHGCKHVQVQLESVPGRPADGGNLRRGQAGAGRRSHKGRRLEAEEGRDHDQRQDMFPVQHSLAMLDAARAGQSIFSADLYDGSEKGEKVFATTAVIGAKTPPGKAPKLSDVKNAEKLEPLASWPISLSYFEKGNDKSDSGPVYELAFLFFENGVSQRLFIDYGDFSIRAR